MRKKSIHLLLVAVFGVWTLLDMAGWSGAADPVAPPDAVMEAQTPRETTVVRAEQKKSAHDQSGIFDATKAPPSSPAFQNQPDQGKVSGFDF